MKKMSVVTLVPLAVMLWLSTALAASNPGLLNWPEIYDGKTVVVDGVRLGKQIHLNEALGCYCLDVEKNGRHIPSYLYSSQLNFIIFSQRLEQKLLAEMNRHREIHEGQYHLLSQVAGTHVPHVRLTCKIEQVKDYWLAEVSKIELYGKAGDIVKTIEE